MGSSVAYRVGHCARKCIFLIVFIHVVWKVECGAFEKDRTCGTLFSEESFEGDAFVLKDWDRSGNTRRDYRTLITGWGSSRSARVEQNCLMTVCDDTYFHGNCRSLGSTQVAYQSLQLMSPVVSVNCTCAEECGFEDVIMPKNELVAGRAYIEKPCDFVEENYIVLRSYGSYGNFPPKYEESVKAIVLRSGCNLTVYSGWSKSGSSRVITTPVVEDFNGTIRSYEYSCDDKAFVRPPRPASYPPLLTLPSTETELLFKMLSSNDSSISGHPGLKAAFKSAVHGRSSRNVYILLIGTRYPFMVDFWNCDGVREEHIGECHVSVDLDQLGVSNAQLRIITVPIADGNEIKVDRWVASLENYLSTHEDLRDAIPNAVVIHHMPLNDDKIVEKGSEFQLKLEAVSALRGRVLDENFSNLVVLLLQYPTPIERENPTARLAEFESVIQSTCFFPKPLFLVPSAMLDYNPPKANGHWKMPNGEYWPGVFVETLLLLSEKGGDPLGAAVFKASFPGDERELTVTLRGNDRALLPQNHPKVLRWGQLLSNQTELQGLFGPFKEGLERWKASIANSTAAGQKPGSLPKVGTGPLPLFPHSEGCEELRAHMEQAEGTHKTLRKEIEDLREKLAAGDEMKKKLEERLLELEIKLSE